MAQAQHRGTGRRANPAKPGPLRLSKGCSWRITQRNATRYVHILTAPSCALFFFFSNSPRGIILYAGAFIVRLPPARQFSMAHPLHKPLLIASITASSILTVNLNPSPSSYGLLLGSAALSARNKGPLKNVCTAFDR